MIEHIFIKGNNEVGFRAYNETQNPNDKYDNQILYLSKDSTGKPHAINQDQVMASNEKMRTYDSISEIQADVKKIWGVELKHYQDLKNNNHEIEGKQIQKNETVLTENYSIKTDGKKFVPVKVETLEGRTYHTAIYEAMGYPQAFNMKHEKDIDFSKGYKNIEAAQKAGQDKWEKQISLEQANQTKTKEKHVIYEKNNKFIPVEMAVEKGRQINSILGPGIKPDHISEKSNVSVPGKLSLSFTKGFDSLKDAQFAVEKKWGKEIKLEIVKIQTKTKTNEQTPPGKAVQRLQNQRKANQGQTNVR